MKKPRNLDRAIARVWDEVKVQVCEDIGSVGLEALCGQILRLRDARSRIDEDGLIVSDARGDPMAHPAIPVEKQAQAEIRLWLQKFPPSEVDF